PGAPVSGAAGRAAIESSGDWRASRLSGALKPRSGARGSAILKDASTRDPATAGASGRLEGAPGDDDGEAGAVNARGCGRTCPNGRLGVSAEARTSGASGNGDRLACDIPRDCGAVKARGCGR